MAKKKIWHLVTNHQNMLYLLAADMVMSKAGFRDKYYTDPLGLYPGWIPLFRDAAFPADVFEYSTSERKHLVPCIASINSSDVFGPYQILSCDGVRSDVTSLRLRKADIAILVRAPLPSGLLQSINFRTEQDRQVFERAAGDVANVDLSAREIKTDENLFSINEKLTWPVQGKAEQKQKTLLEEYKEVSAVEDVSDTIPAFGQAIGGALAMLYHGANRSESGLAAFKVATSSAGNADKEKLANDKILTDLHQWMSSGEVSEQADISAALYWGVVNSLIASSEERRSEERQREEQTQQTQEPVDVMLAYLVGQLDKLPDTNLRPRLEALLADMRGLNGLGGGTITELLERHPGRLSKSLLLFCLREHCIDLLEYSHPLLSDIDYVLAGILFGVRDTWLQLPHALREPGLTAYVAYRMAQAQHQKQGDQQQGDHFSLKAPESPIPLRELFPSTSEAWSKKQLKVAEDLASQCQWNDCIETRIALGEGEWPEEFKRDGLQLVLSGKATAKAPQLSKVKFLHRLAAWPPIDRTIETSVRKQLLRKRKTPVPASTKGTASSDATA